MARYIDLDKAIQDVESVGAYYSEEETVKELCLFELKGQQIADVVPRSEVEEIVKFKDMAYAELKSLFIEAKQEVARNIIADFRKMINGYENIDVYLDRIEEKYMGE